MAAPSAAAPAAQPLAPVEQRETASLLAGVCQQRALPDAPAGELRFGCACCAPFEGCAPGDSPVAAPERLYWPRWTVAGSFTAAGAEQRVMALDGCESHAANHGGLLLLGKREAGFVQERYVSGLNPSECRAVRRDDGRDALLCRSHDAHQGVASDALWQWDLAAEDASLQAQEPLVFVEDEELSGCWGPIGTQVSSARIKKVEDAQREGRLELTVEIELREGRVSAEYLKRCEDAERAANAGNPLDSLPAARELLRQRVERRRFRFDGARFLSR